VSIYFFERTYPSINATKNIAIKPPSIGKPGGGGGDGGGGVSPGAPNTICAFNNRATKKAIFSNVIFIGRKKYKFFLSDQRKLFYLKFC
jgi:hypothetical protein